MPAPILFQYITWKRHLPPEPDVCSKSDPSPDRPVYSQTPAFTSPTSKAQYSCQVWDLAFPAPGAVPSCFSIVWNNYPGFRLFPLPGAFPISSSVMKMLTYPD